MQLVPYGTYTARGSASGVPYVPRTVGPQAAAVGAALAEGDFTKLFCLDVQAEVVRFVSTALVTHYYYIRTYSLLLAKFLGFDVHMSVT